MAKYTEVLDLVDLLVAVAHSESFAAGSVASITRNAAMRFVEA